MRLTRRGKRTLSGALAESGYRTHVGPLDRQLDSSISTRPSPQFPKRKIQCPEARADKVSNNGVTNEPEVIATVKKSNADPDD